MKLLNRLKIGFVSLLITCSLNLWAHDFEVDGIYYKITDATNFEVEVSYKGSSSSQYSNEYSGKVIIPAIVIYNNTSYNIKGISNEAFCNCTLLTSIRIPNSVDKVGVAAFYNCSKLSELIIEDGEDLINLTNGSMYQYIPIYDYSAYVRAPQFSSCPLKYIYLGRDFTYTLTSTSTVEYPFYNKSTIETVIIGNKVKDVKQYDFPAKTNLYFTSNPSIKTYATCHLMLNDGNAADFNTTNANTYSTVSYTRTISEGKYGTIMLPFAPDAASLENYAFYELAESGDGYMKFEEVVAPVANTPYIYTLREGKENIAITGGETTISSNIVTPEVDGWQTIGSFNNQTIDTSGGNYYALSATDNEINRITKSLTVLPYRAYFKSADASKSALNIYISGTTGIEKISLSEIEGFENGAIFDLSGRKVTEPINGNIYIKNGKKIMF